VGDDDDLNSGMEPVGGGHPPERDSCGRESNQVGGGTSRSPNDGPPRHGGVSSGRRPPDRLFDLSRLGPGGTRPHDRPRDHLRFGSDCTDDSRFVCLSRRSVLCGPRLRDDPCGPELASAPFRDTARGNPHGRLPGVHALARRPGDPPSRGVRRDRLVVGLHPAPRPLTEGAWVALSTDGRKWTFDRNWSGVFKGRLWLPTDLFVPPLYGLHRRRPSVMAHRSADGRIGP